MANKIKSIVFLLIFSISTGKLYADNSWKNWYGIEWRDTATNSVRYAKAMGYKYIVVSHQMRNVDVYKNNPACAGMKFYFLDPHYSSETSTNKIGNVISAPFPNPGAEDYSYFDQVNYGTYSTARKNFLLQNACYRYPNSGTTTAPTCFAPGWVSGNQNRVTWNLQNATINNNLVQTIMDMAAGFEAQPGDAGYPFDFGGCMFDSVLIDGEFQEVGGGGQQYISNWTGTSSAIAHGTVTNNLGDGSWADGAAAFLKNLKGSMTAFKALKSGRNDKIIYQPGEIYHATWIGTYVDAVNGRSDAALLLPDQLMQENADTGTQLRFQDPLIFTGNNCGITYAIVGVASNATLDESVSRFETVGLGTETGYSNWFGNFANSGALYTGSQTISAIDPWRKLIRVWANWGDLMGATTVQATVGGTTTGNGILNSNLVSHIDQNVIYCRHPDNNHKVYCCFNTGTTPPAGSMTIHTGEHLVSIEDVNGFLEPVSFVTSNFTISGNDIIPNANIVGTTSGALYIFTVADDGSKTTSMSGGGSIQMSGGGSITIQ